MVDPSWVVVVRAAGRRGAGAPPAEARLQILIGRGELERGADRAGGEAPGQPLHDRADGLDAGAVLRHDVLDVELAKGVDDPGDARIVETAQMEAADDGVNPGNPGEADGVAADTDDAAVRARRDHDEAAVAHVGHQGLLADERVLEELALLLDAEVRRNGLPLLGGVHLPREPEPFGDRRRLGDQPHVDLVPLDLVAGQAATVDPALPALLPARPEVIDATVERQIAAKPPAPPVQEAGPPAPWG